MRSSNDAERVETSAESNVEEDGKRISADVPFTSVKTTLRRDGGNACSGQGNKGKPISREKRDVASPYYTRASRRHNVHIFIHT